MSKNNIEPAKFMAVGETIDRIYDTKGNLVEEIKGHNIVVNSFLKVITSLIKNVSNPTANPQKITWYVGNGNKAPTVNDNTLNNIIGSKKVSDIRFIDPDTNAESELPTTAIQISCIFNANECNGNWSEFALALDTTNGSCILIDRRVHSPIVKDNEMVIERVLRLKLELGTIEE